MKRPKTVWLLLAYFTSCVVGAGLVLAGYENNNEFQMFRAAGLETLFFVLFAALFLLSAATVRAIWAPSPSAIRTGITTIVATLAYEAISSSVALSNPEAFRAAITAEMTARGQAEHAETAFALAMSPPTLAVSVVVTLALAALGTWLFLWNRAYFEGGGRNSAA
ncbi:MAG TPA: hypothetical protein VFO62_12230 [Candidatus Binatia bacterium]|nr:hypothetical protein [Candidatus Binatia bacterium]